MGLFDAGQATQTSTPGSLSPADVAGKLFAIKLLLARLQQGGGAPQTLGEYIKSGPRKLPSNVTAQGGDALMAALSQPGAFNRGPSVQKYKPSSPSLFQDASGGLVTLALLSSLLKGQGGISGAGGSMMDWLRNLGQGSGTPIGPGSPDYGIALNDPGQYSDVPAMNFNLGAYNDPGYGVMDTSGTGTSFLNSLFSSGY